MEQTRRRAAARRWMELLAVMITMMVSLFIYLDGCVHDAQIFKGGKDEEMLPELG